MVMLLDGSCLQSKSLWNESYRIAIESLIPILVFLERQVAIFFELLLKFRALRSFALDYGRCPKFWAPLLKHTFLPTPVMKLRSHALETCALNRQLWWFTPIICTQVNFWYILEFW